MAKTFSSAKEAAKARGALLKRLMDERGLTPAILADSLGKKLGRSTNSVKVLLYNVRTGIANLSEQMAEAIAPYVGTSAEELLIRPMANPRGSGSSKTAVPKVARAQKGRRKKPSSPAKAFRKLLKQRKLSVAEVVRRIGGSEKEEETLVDASQRVGEISEELWVRIQSAFAAKPEEKSDETVAIAAESNGQLAAGQVLFAGAVSVEEFHALFGGEVRIVRQGGAIRISAPTIEATPQHRDLLAKLVLPELHEE